MTKPQLSDDELDRIGRVVHEAVRAFQTSLGQKPARGWNSAPDWMRKATCDAITFRLENPEAPASAQHDQWVDDKKADGWTFGTVKNATKKTHPLLVDYSELPLEERQKDALVGAIIDALTSPL